MYFRFDEDGTFVCADERKVYTDMLDITPPKEFSFDNACEWKYKNGEWTHTPHYPPPPQPTQAERIAALEEELRAAKILLGLEV